MPRKKSTGKKKKSRGRRSSASKKLTRHIMSYKPRWASTTSSPEVSAFYDGLTNEIAYAFGYDAFRAANASGEERDDDSSDDDLGDSDFEGDGDGGESSACHIPAEIWANGVPAPENLSAEEADLRNRQHTALRKVRVWLFSRGSVLNARASRRRLLRGATTTTRRPLKGR